MPSLKCSGHLKFRTFQMFCLPLFHFLFVYSIKFSFYLLIWRTIICKPNIISFRSFSNIRTKLYYATHWLCINGIMPACCASNLWIELIQNRIHIFPEHLVLYRHRPGDMDILNHGNQITRLGNFIYIM